MENTWKNRKVLITGGLGFIGSNLAHRLAGLGADVLIVDSLSSVVGETRYAAERWAAVRRWLADQPGIEDVHDLHIWAISTTETALTAHLLRPANTDADAFLHATCEGLASRFGIGHSTLQVETDAAHACRLAPAEVV